MPKDLYLALHKKQRRMIEDALQEGIDELEHADKEFGHGVSTVSVKMKKALLIMQEGAMLVAVG